MITGVVTADREAVVRLTVRGPERQELTIEAVIDTGFDGWLSLPPNSIARLRLPWRQRGRAILADGSESVFDIYEGTAIWDRQPRRIPVDEAETAPLVGMSLLWEHELVIQLRPRGRVAITRLTQERNNGGFR
jgi:clan AA aspartic protease